MSEMEATSERSNHDDTQLSGVDSVTGGDRPQTLWTMLPQDARFDAFNGAVCLDIRCTVSTKLQLPCYKMLKATSVPQG